METPTVAGSSDEVDINVSVEEKPSGSLLAGIGYSQSDGIVLNGSITQENFAGTGKRVSLALKTSSADQLYQVSFDNPYYTVDGVSRGFNLIYRSTDFADLSTADFKTDDLILGVNFGIPLSEFNRFNFGFGVHNTDFEVGSNPSQEVLDFEAAEGNKFLDFEIDLNWSRDSRDTAIFPNTGILQSFNVETTIPGSDLKYYKLTYRHKQYWRLTKRLVTSLRGRISYGEPYGGTTTLPLWERFYLGGPTSLRGFASRSVGPRDSQGDPIGANAAYNGSFELSAPPPFQKTSETVRLAAFADFGAAFDTSETDIFDTSELRYSVGLGASWLSPVGALTVSYAIPFRADELDEEEQFQFTFGTTF